MKSNKNFLKYKFTELNDLDILKEAFESTPYFAVQGKIEAEWEKIKNKLKLGVPPIKGQSYKNRFNLILNTFQRNQSINKKKTETEGNIAEIEEYCKKIKCVIDNQKRLQLIGKIIPEAQRNSEIENSTTNDAVSTLMEEVNEENVETSPIKRKNKSRAEIIVPKDVVEEDQTNRELRSQELELDPKRIRLNSNQPELDYIETREEE